MRLLDRMRDAIRVRQCSLMTEKSYLDWAKRFILFQDKRHPIEMGKVEVEAFLTYLADNFAKLPLAFQRKLGKSSTQLCWQYLFPSKCIAEDPREPGMRYRWYVHLDVLTCHDMSCNLLQMAKIKISSKVEEREWAALQALAAESNQSIAGLLSEAVADYVRKKRLRPSVMTHLEDSISENEELGKLLAQ